jgi:phosphatidylglycerophosphate synthase
MNRSFWPNLVSGVRIALMPAVLTAAMAGSRRWFVGLLAVSLMTDALDGFLARRFNAYSELGRKLDSAADYLAIVTGLAGISMLWPEIIHREWPWVTAALTAFLAVIVYGLVRLGRAPCYHTWASKVAAVLFVLSLVPLLAGWAAWLFHLVVVLQVATAVDELAIAWLLPHWSGEVPSCWHARRMRREAAALTPRAEPRTSGDR